MELASVAEFEPSFNPKPEAKAGAAGTPRLPNAFASGFGLND
jgi:hypothetical protein